MPTSNRSPDKASNRSPEKKMDTGAPSSATFNPPSALPDKSATTVKSGYSSAEKVLDVLRHAQDELEKRVSDELKKCGNTHLTTRRELEEARAENARLQKELDKLQTQQKYKADAFEASRKETAKLKTENALANEELVRLRKAVEEMQADRIAGTVGRKVVDAELSELEVQVDVLSRALGAATKELFGKAQKKKAAAEEKERERERWRQQKATGGGARPPPSGKALGSPGRAGSGSTPTMTGRSSSTVAQTPTGGEKQRRPSTGSVASSAGGGARSAWA